MTGAIGQNDSFYLEGDSVPQRLFHDLDNGGTYTMGFEYDFTQNDIYAYDFLTNLNEAQNTLALLDTCQPATPNFWIDPGECDGSNTLYEPTGDGGKAIDVPIPSDTFGPTGDAVHPAEKVSDAETPAVRNTRLGCDPGPCTVSGTPTTLVHVPATTCLGCDSTCGNSIVQIFLTFTYNRGHRH